MKHGIVLTRVQAHNEVWSDGPAIPNMLLEPCQCPILLIHNPYLPAGKNDVLIGDGTRRPFLVQVASTGKLGHAHNNGHVSLAISDEKNKTTVVSNRLDYTGGTAEVGGGRLEADDVNAGTLAIDVAGIGGVPLRDVVAHVRLCGHEVLECDIVGRVLQDFVGEVAKVEPGTKRLCFVLVGFILEELGRKLVDLGFQIGRRSSRIGGSLGC